MIIIGYDMHHASRISFYICRKYTGAAQEQQKRTKQQRKKKKGALKSSAVASVMDEAIKGAEEASMNASKTADAVIDQISPYLEAGDLLIDGGNSEYKDTERRVAKL